jgi:hypothetical protein
MVVRVGNTRTGGGNIDIGKLSLLAAKGLSSPITFYLVHIRVLISLYPKNF